MKDYIKSMKEQINQIAHMQGINYQDVLTDFVHLSLNVFYLTPLIEHFFKDSTFATNHTFRNHVIKTKNHPEAMAKLEELVFFYMDAVKKSEPFTDFLSHLLIGNKALGQFPTPPHIAQLLAQLVDQDEQPGHIADPSGCGAGSLMLGYLYTHSHNKDFLSQTEITLTDLDLNMVKMATLQIMMNICLHQTPIKELNCYCMNALTGNYETSKVFNFTYKVEPLLKMLLQAQDKNRAIKQTQTA